MRTRGMPINAERLDLLRWVASLGAITAEALSVREDISLRSARARLSAAHRDNLLARTRVLSERPALFTLTATGMRAVGLPAAKRCRVSASAANHLILCAQVAASLERSYCGYRVIGERELRRAERACGHPLASARISGAYADRSGRHHPDLVLMPIDGEGALPVAVEVELTVKAPRRLREICRAWGRNPRVAGVIYLVDEPVERPLSRAVAAVGAQEQIAVVRLDALPGERR